MKPALIVSSFLVCLLCFCAPNQAQHPPIVEMRGAWIATVANIDWPSKPGLSPDRQRMEFDSILDVLRGTGINAVFVQVRPAGDAFYPSPSAPWSKYLTGVQGQAPEPYYDPLQYMIEAAHTRRMEFHAWLNPYRATFDLDTASLAPSHPLRSLPPERLSQWFFRYGNRFYFNPANDLVIRYLTNLVHDICLRYDVDGIHFDDYFYPYKEPGQFLDDYNEFAANPRGFSNLEDWRRDNINRMIESVSKSIKSFKPHVKFGVGPFGVWRNSDRDPINGSETRSGVTSYDDLYADVLLWLRNGWIDYVAPQLYWSIGFAPADYDALLDWWSRNTYGRHLYIGHAAYKVGAGGNDPGWNDPRQIGMQVRNARAYSNVQGGIYYSARPLMRNPLGLRDTLIRNLYPNQALMPPFRGLSKLPPATPQFCGLKGTPAAVRLAWQVCDVASGEEMPYYYAVYRFPGEGVGDFQDSRSLLFLSAFNPEKLTFDDVTTQDGQYYTYVVVAYNRYHAESYSSEPLYVKRTRKGAKAKRKFWGYMF